MTTEPNDGDVDHGDDRVDLTVDPEPYPGRPGYPQDDMTEDPVPDDAGDDTQADIERIAGTGDDGTGDW